MNSSLLFALCLVALVTVAPSVLYSSKFLEESWKAFKINFGKTYKDADEEMYRKKIFADTLKVIEIQNFFYSQGLVTSEIGINQFSDLEPSEIESPPKKRVKSPGDS